MWETIKKNRYKYGVLAMVACIILFAARKAYYNPFSVLAHLYPEEYMIVKIAYTVLAITVIVMFGVLLRLMKDRPIEKIAFFMIIVFGLMYMVVLPPYSTPDEALHLSTSYCYSNKLMGQDDVDDDGHTLFRTEDTNYTHEDNHIPTARSYEKMARGFFSIDKSEGTQCMNWEPLSVPPTAYLPQIIGVTIARIFHLGNIPMLMLGRLMAMLFFAVCVYFTIKITPLGKELFMVAALFPTTMQLATSFSYDVTTISLSFFYTGFLFYLMYSVETIERKHWIALAVLFAWLSPIKVVYVLLGFTLLIIPKEKFAKGSHKYLFVATAVLAGGLLILVTRLTSVVNVAAEGALNVETYSLSFLLSHPRKIVSLGVATVITMSTYYLETMIGQHLGWLEIGIPGYIIYAFFVLLIIASIRIENEKEVLKSGQRLWVFLVIAATTFCIGLALCLDWTPVNSECVEGIQGRYLTPMLPMLMILFKNNQIEMKNSMSKYLATALYFMQALTLFTLAHIIGGR